jgi:hypothetical protein
MPSLVAVPRVYVAPLSLLADKRVRPMLTVPVPAQAQVHADVQGGSLTNGESQMPMLAAAAFANESEETRVGRRWLLLA